MRRLMPLHFSLVVCYYDNKDPFDARRPFYLQISLLNVISVRARGRLCAIFTLKRPILVLSFLLRWKIDAVYALSHAAPALDLFLLIVTSQ